MAGGYKRNYTKRTNGTNKRSRTSVRRTRRYRNNARRTTRYKTIVNTGLGFPQRMKMTHRYVTTVGLNSTSGAIGTYKFACNGLYDPDITGTGHQPMFFDQMAAIYNHYHVIGSKISVQIVPAEDNSITRPCHCAIVLNDDSTAYTNMDTIRERAKSQYRLLNPEQARGVTLSSKWSAKKTFGGSVIANDELGGDTTSNPLEETQYHIHVQTADLLTTTALYLNVTITYIAIWNEMKDVGGS